MLRLYLPLYVLLFVYTLAFTPVMEWLLVQLAEDAVIEDTLGDFEGAFYIVDELLNRVPPSEWPETLASMSSRNIPVTLLSQQELPDAPELSERLLTGELLVYDAENTVLIKQLSNHDLFIKIGPVDTVDSLSLVYLIGLLAGSALLLVLVDLWAWSVQRKIHHLSRVTERIGRGDLSVRANTHPGKSLGRLNSDFNRMADQIQQLIEAHKHLTNAVSHELRTPISRIRFELDYAGSHNNLEDMHASLDSIAEDTQELEKLVSELLSYARYERSSLELSVDHYPLKDWLQDWFVQFQQTNQSLLTGTELSLHLPESAATSLVAFNADAISRVLDNLVLNAQRYAKSRVEIRLEWKGHWGTGEPSGWPIIRVDDDGPGIPEDQREALLQPFVRADSSRSRQTGGVGLGLAIVAQIMARHGGRVDIADSPLGGAQFRVTWPETAQQTASANQ